MRSLVVLFALVAVGMAAPNLRHYSVGYAVPSAITSYGTPVVAEQVVAAPAVVDARSVYSPVTAVYTPSALSHQSRVDYHSSPAVLSEQVVSPAVYEARSVYGPSVYTPSVYAPSVYAPYW